MTSAAPIPCASCGTPAAVLIAYDSPRGPYSLCVACVDWPRPAATHVEVRATQRRTKR